MNVERLRNLIEMNSFKETDMARKKKRKLPPVLKANQQCMMEMHWLTDPAKRRRLFKKGMTAAEKRALKACRDRKLARMRGR